MRAADGGRLLADAGRCLVAATLVAASGCEWFSTMSDPPGIEPHEREPWAPAEGAVPLDGDPGYTLADVDQVGLENPRAPDSASVAVGEAYFQAFCAVCHGEQGLGNGPISDRFPAIPSIVTASVAGRSDAYVYGLVTQGRGLMPEYSRIPRTARWDIVNFVRALPARVGSADTTAVGTAGAAAAPAATAGGRADTTGGGDR